MRIWCLLGRVWSVGVFNCSEKLQERKEEPDCLQKVIQHLQMYIMHEQALFQTLSIVLGHCLKFYLLNIHNLDSG